MRLALFSLCAVISTACSPSNDSDSHTQESPFPNSICDSGCDSSPLSIPVTTESGGYGAVTTYGNPTDPETSSGGACNYGNTGILNYAAIYVNLQEGDSQGLWQGGRACGDCYQVQVGAPEGWKTVVVRIVDKCPDFGCGIDLGGAPAQSLMGTKPGRYTGQWERVICPHSPLVSDGPTVLFVKEGSNAWWSVVQIRNGPSSTQSIEYHIPQTGETGAFAWATEAENYWKVPTDILSLSDTVEFRITFRTGESSVIHLPGRALSQEGSLWEL